ncbi:MAG: Stp1/IreP family PP2C-type Ser/Thr phosphatase [Candidatus Rifleibacteriota bacterium]
MFAVADGMGGQNAGEVASGLAVKTAREWLENNSVENLSLTMVEELFAQANQEIWSYAQSHPEASGMGTTLTLLLIEGDRAVVGHIGDSRLYRFRNNKLEQLTNDHTLVGEQVRMGKLTIEQARVHPTRHILSRVLGVRQFVNPDIFMLDLKENDLFLICSDGVSGMVEDKILEKYLSEKDASNLAKAIVDEANERGGKDNCTAVTVKIEKLPVAMPGRFSFDRLYSMLSHWKDAGTI